MSKVKYIQTHLLFLFSRYQLYCTSIFLIHALTKIEQSITHICQATHSGGFHISYSIRIMSGLGCDHQYTIQWMATANTGTDLAYQSAMYPQTYTHGNCYSLKKQQVSVERASCFRYPTKHGQEFVGILFRNVDRLND